MSLVNIVEFSTAVGYKSIELHHADITKFEKQVDLLVISAFKKNYDPTNGTIIQFLQSNLDINVAELSQKSELDFRHQMNIWLSERLKTVFFDRILCIEGMLAFDIEKSLNDSFRNLFSFISLLEYHNIKIKSIVMPLLGSGDQAIKSEDIIPIMMYYFKKALETNLNLSKIYVVEINSEKVQNIKLGFDKYLKNEHLEIGKINADQVLVEELIRSLKYLQNRDADYKYDESTNALIDRLERNDLSLYEFGILCRRFLELSVQKILGDTIPKNSNLKKKIDALHKKNTAKWIIDYFHVIRNIGNSAAHSQNILNPTFPARVGKNDIQATIVILKCIVEFLNSQSK
jgi:hypothetical protein